jgi:hypothetical protein
MINARLKILLSELTDRDLEEKIFRSKKDELTSSLRQLRNRETELIQLTTQGPPRDELAELFIRMRQHQEIILLENEPYNIRRTWVEALGIRGILRPDNTDNVRIRCDLGEFLLSIADIPSPGYGHKLELRYSVDIPILAAK